MDILNKIIKCAFNLILKIIIFVFLINCASATERIILIRDDEAESLIRELLKPILKISGLDHNSISINIINQREPNAFIMLGQNIFISTGLISFSDNPDALIGVLAHEAGHIKGGHLIQQTRELKNLETKMLLGLLAGAVVGVASKSTEAATGTIIGMQNINEKTYLSFNRAQENAADSSSIKVMKQLGISNDGLLNFLKSLKTIEKTFYSDVSEYERTHPLSKDRIEYIKANSSIIASDKIVTKEIRARFKMLHAKILAFTSLPKFIFNYYQENDEYSGQYARAIAYFKEQNLSQSIYLIDKLIKAIPNNPYLYELKAQIYYELGKIYESVEFYHMAHKLKPSSTTISMEYANALIANNKNINLAIALLNQITSKNRDEVYAWWLLSKSYKLVGDDNNMHIAIAYNSYLNGDLDTVQKHINAIKKASLNLIETNKLTDLKHLIKEQHLEE